MVSCQDVEMRLLELLREEPPRRADSSCQVLLKLSAKNGLNGPVSGALWNGGKRRSPPSTSRHPYSQKSAVDSGERRRKGDEGRGES